MVPENPTFKQAPILKSNGFEYPNGRYNKRNNPDGDLFDTISRPLETIVFNTLSGKSGNAIKIMMVLLGTKKDAGFGVSQKWIMNRTGIPSAQSYYNARKELEKLGWITVEDNNLYINYDNIRKSGQGHNDNACPMNDDDEPLFQMTAVNSGQGHLENASPTFSNMDLKNETVVFLGQGHDQNSAQHFQNRQGHDQNACKHFQNEIESSSNRTITNKLINNKINNKENKLINNLIIPAENEVLC